MLSRIMVDFSEAGETFEPLPNGVYYATIDASSASEVRVSQDSEKKTPYITLTFVIDAPDEFAGRKVWENFPIAGKGAFRLRDLLLALGREVSPGVEPVDIPWLHGRQVAIKVGQRTYQGTIRNRIEAFMALTDEAGNGAA